MTPDRTPSPDATPAHLELSVRDRAILAMESQWFKYEGVKEQAIREQFGISSTRYYQLLRAIIQTPAALEADPLTTKRLLRVAESRARSRSAKRLP